MENHPSSFAPTRACLSARRVRAVRHSVILALLAMSLFGVLTAPPAFTAGQTGGMQGDSTAMPVPEPPSILPPDVPAIEPDRLDRNYWQYIVIHHSASPSGNAAAFDRMHRGKGWDGLAYHFVIDNGRGGPDGHLEIGARWWKQKHGAHAGGLRYAPAVERNCYNEFGIGICLVGNLEQRPPTPAQMDTLVRLVGQLQNEFGIEEEAILGHRHVRQTACPGRYFPWKALFARLGLPEPTHLFQHSASGTTDRCPWCLRLPALAARHLKPAPPQPEGSDLPPDERKDLK